MSLNEFEQLLKRYYEGQCSPKEKTWVDKWLENTNLQTKSPWERLSQEEKQVYIDNLYSDIKTSIQTESEAEVSVDHISRRRWIWPAAVAASIACAIGLYFSFQQKDISVEQQRVQEWTSLDLESGKRKKIALSDGTVIWLQGGSSLDYPQLFDSTVRVVRLDGEAFFEVASDTAKPFIVKSGDLETQVLGTSFNIKAFSELGEKVVSLVEGKLAVRSLGIAGEIAQEVLLSASEAAVFSAQDRTLAKSDMPVFNSSDDFKLGSLSFDDTPLDQALFRISKAYGIEIRFDRAKAAKHKINAAFSISDPVKEVVQSMAKSTGSSLVWKEEHRADFNLK